MPKFEQETLHNIIDFGLDRGFDNEQVKPLFPWYSNVIYAKSLTYKLLSKLKGLK